MFVGERTPNSLFDVFGLGNALVEKGKCPKKQAKEVAENLPLAWQKPKVLGSGDWGHTRSSEGSIVLGWGQKYVVKVPLGNPERDPYDWASEQRKMISLFAGISPPSMIIVARVDDSLPKPIVIQRRINGKPACETPFSRLLDKETLADMRHIIRRVREVYFNEGVLDLCGQRFSSRILSRTAGFLPFFSDNIMVDAEGHASFTDNTPDCTFANTKGKSLIRKAVNTVRFTIVEGLIDTLSVLRRGRDLIALKQPKMVTKTSIGPSESSVLMAE